MDKPSTDRVVIFRRDLLPWSETFIREQALALQSWRPILVGEHRVENGLPLDQLDARLLPHEHKTFAFRIFRHLYHQLRLPYPTLLQLIRGLDANLIHAHFGLDGTLVWPIARALNLPLLVTLHGYDVNIHRDWWESGRGGRLWARYPKHLLQMAHEPKVHWIAVSEAIRRQAIAFGIPASKITTCYIGIDTERFRPCGKPLSERRKRIIFIGRMVEKKGPLMMICAFAQVSERVPNAELIMVGDGPLRVDAEELAKQLHLQVVFTGAMTSDKIIEQLQEARVLCLPSITASNGDAEGLPIVILEAQSCGIPVVTSARGGAKEGILDGRSGYSHQEGSIVALKKAIITLLVDDNLTEKFGKEARKNIFENMNIKICTKLIEKKYISMNDENSN